MNAGLKQRRGLGKFGLPMINLGPQNGEVHLSHFTPEVLDQLLQNTHFSILEKTLDPYYLRGRRINRLKADAYYYSCLAFMRIFNVNLYDTMLVTARRNSIDSTAQVASRP